MTALENFYNYSQNHLGAKDERCGEIFITYSRNIIIHCTICGSNFESYNYFLDHLSTEHYEEVQEEVIEIDAETETPLQNVQINFKPIVGQSGKILEETETPLQTVKISFKPIVGQSEKILLEEPNSCSSNKTENIIDEFQDYDLEEINDEEETEAQNFYAQTLDETPLQTVKISFKPIVGQSEKILLEEPNSCSSNETENIIDVFQDYDLEEISDEEETEAQNFYVQTLDEIFNTTKTSSSSPKIYGKSFNCDKCDKVYSRKNSLTRHYKCHTQPMDKTSNTTETSRSSPRSDCKSFSCDKCDKVFSRNLYLRRHYIHHTTERNHLCHICGLTFKKSFSLNLHARRHTGIKPISCGFCPKRFYTLAEATPHRRKHAGIRPYVCSTCGMAYTNSGSLNLHVMKHNSKPSIKCNFCDKVFYMKNAFNSHMVVHTKEKTFVCHICGAKFPRSQSMEVHVKRMHERNKTTVAKAI